MTEFQKQAAHSAQQAMTPGWYAYSRASVAALETDKATAAMFAGLRAAVGSLIRARGYRPAQHELKELK